MENLNTPVNNEEEIKVEVTQNVTFWGKLKNFASKKAVKIVAGGLLVLGTGAVILLTGDKGLNNVEDIVKIGNKEDILPEA